MTKTNLPNSTDAKPDLHRDLYVAQSLSNDGLALDRYNALFTKNGDPRDEAVLQWRYVDNTAADASETVIAVDTVESQEDAALYTMMGVPLWLDGTSTKAVQSLDTLTDINHRRQGLFPFLANRAYDDAHNNGSALVYGFPNGNSIHSFTKKLEWVSLDPVPFLIKPLKAGYFLEKLLPGPLKALSKLNVPLARKPSLPAGYDVHELTSFGESYDVMWDAFRQSGSAAVGVDRTSAYMNWRLRDYPRGGNYRLSELTRNGELKGIVAWTVEEKHGGRIGYVLELLHHPGDDEAGKALASIALADMHDKGCDAVLGWCCDHSPNYAAYQGSGFLPMPEKLRPIELHWGVRALATDQAEIVNNRASWYISYLDSDTV